MNTLQQNQVSTNSENDFTYPQFTPRSTENKENSIKLYTCSPVLAKNSEKSAMRIDTPQIFLTNETEIQKAIQEKMREIQIRVAAVESIDEYQNTYGIFHSDVERDYVLRLFQDMNAVLAQSAGLFD